MVTNLQQLLNKHFHYEQFKDGQEEIVTDVLLGKDVLGILPTGSGKSLCYQLPSVIFPGLTLVISPLISLMIDQVRETKAFHVKEVVALHSLQTYEERQNVLQQLSHYKLLYLSPELLQQEKIVQRLLGVKISLFVIDEAHCISQWGHEFRPDYLRLKNGLERLGNPPVLALTGTATENVQKDIMKQLNRPHMIQHVYPTERTNIGLLIERIKPAIKSKQQHLVEILNTYRQPTIIYFSSRKIAEDISEYLAIQLSNRAIAYYHGGMNPEDRLKIQQQFLYDQLDIICATSAFGMGINKSNIRIVIHYHVPTQLESFIQEIGRAGRDGGESVSIVLYEEGDEQIPLQMISNELPTETEIRAAMNHLYLLSQRNATMSLSQRELEELFALSSTKTRFLLYQFESHGMIRENRIFYEQTEWGNALVQMIRFCHERTEIKQQQFYEVMKYVYTKDCLRQQLYNRFQRSVSKKSSQCCSNCGFLFANWVNSEQEITIEQNSWQQQLAELLCIGDTNEAK